jgi:predicted PurR-regulated permease PerM
MPEKAAVTLPSYVKVMCITILVLLLFYIISIGQGILLPLGFAFLLSILLQPIEKWLVSRGMPRVISIIICLLLFVLVIFLLVSFVSQQVTSLADDFPKIKKSLNGLWDKSQTWMYEKLNISYSKQEEMAENAKNEAVNNMAPATLII